MGRNSHASHRTLSSSYEAESEKTSYSEYSEDVESSSSSPRKPTPPRVVADRYRLGEKVGEGSYSDVHMAVDKISGEKVAVKLEWTKAEKTNKLINEAELYKEFKDVIGIPKVLWSGSHGEYNIMVLELLGPSLDDHFRKQKRFSVKTVALLAKQVFDRLEGVHDCGILYRDIKPHNFLMGLGAKGSKRLYLVDFGLSKRWRDEETGKHSQVQIKKGRGITGTVRYSSPNVHEGYDASRRDDLLAFGYVMLHFLRGGLPWLRISAKSKKTRNRMIARRKAQTSDADLCKDLPNGFIKYFEYCRALDFYDRPDYTRLQNIFDDILREGGFTNDLIYDWTPKRSREVSSASDSRATTAGPSQTTDASSKRRRRE